MTANQERRLFGSDRSLRTFAASLEQACSLLADGFNIRHAGISVRVENRVEATKSRDAIVAVRGISNRSDADRLRQAIEHLSRGFVRIRTEIRT